MPHINHLRMLLASVKARPARLLDMGIWVRDTSKPPCKTRACIAGGYCLTYPEAYLCLGRLGDNVTLDVQQKHFNKLFGVDACEVYFGLSRRAATYIFLPRADDQFLKPGELKANILERIEAVLGGYEPPPQPGDPDYVLPRRNPPALNPPR